MRFKVLEGRMVLACHADQGFTSANLEETPGKPMVRKYLRICPGVDGKCGEKPRPTERGMNESRVKENRGLKKENRNPGRTRGSFVSSGATRILPLLKNQGIHGIRESGGGVLPKCCQQPRWGIAQ
jgi:ribosomal protein L34E